MIHPFSWGQASSELPLFFLWRIDDFQIATALSFLFIYLVLMLLLCVY